MRVKRYGILFLLAILPLYSETLREQNKAYFDALQWEALNELAVPPVPEAYTIENSTPIPYADTIDEGGILPSLPQLGILDYQNIPEDLLVFCDTIAAAIVAKSIDNALFSAQKAFLPHLGRFMVEHFPNFSCAFYGRPSFKQDGSALIPLRLAVKKDSRGSNAAVEAKDENLSEAPPFFAEAEQPLFIMLEIGALEEGGAWKISYIDLKGAEYADSALTD